MTPQRDRLATLRRDGGVDPRLKLFLALGFGLLAWRASPLGLLVLALAPLALLLGLRRPAQGPFAGGEAKGYVVFVLFWAACKLGADLAFDARPVAASLLETGLLAARLSAALLAGLALARWASPRELGLALSSLLGPFLGRAAWQTALVLALMVHWLPLLRDSVSRVRGVAAWRAPDLPWRRRIILVPQAVLRVMAQKSWAQTMAIAARGLDEPDAWRAALPFHFGQWLVGGLLLALAAIAGRL